ncbi:MAG TPA: DUF4124 domain-containing protein [Burkholderiales bacterium]
MQHHSLAIRCLALAFVGSTWLAAPSLAATYKWTDANGEVHYSDQPPPPSVKGPVTVKPGKSSPGIPATAPAPADKAAAPKAKTYIEQEAEFRKRQVEAAEREAEEKKKADEAIAKKQNCEQARAQLRGLQAGGRVTRTNAKGEREYLNDAQIAEAIDNAKKSADSWCK